MSEGLIIGFDLCDNYTQIAIYDEETSDAQEIKLTDESDEIPTTICKVRRREEWKIGEAACEMALLGSGIAVDKLLRLVKKGGVATLEGRTYTAGELLDIYIRETLGFVTAKYDRKIEKVIYCVKELRTPLADQIVKSCEKLGVKRENVKVLSHTEAYLYYLLRRPAEQLTNYSVLFDLSKEGLRYFECNILRGVTPNVAQAEVSDLEEGFSLDILESEPGRKLADNIFSSCVQRRFSGKIISNVYLTGSGLTGIQDWGKKSLSILCNRRKVYLEKALFAKGAVWAGMGDAPACTFVCDGRISASVGMNMTVGGIAKNITLIEAGERWYDSSASTEFYLDGEDGIDLFITPAGGRKSAVRRISLSQFPQRPAGTTRVRLELSFSSENELGVCIRDMGFGEIYPASSEVIENRFSIQ